MDVKEFFIILFECLGGYWIFSKLTSICAGILNAPFCLVSPLVGMIPWAFHFYYIAAFFAYYSELSGNKILFFVIVSLIFFIISVTNKPNNDNDGVRLCMNLLFPILAIVAMCIMGYNKAFPLAQPVIFFVDSIRKLYFVPVIGIVINVGVIIFGVVSSAIYLILAILGIKAILNGDY